jgi:hypothetical protein
MFEAYCFANLHVLRLLDEHKTIPKLDQSFFYVCCCYVSALYKKNAKEQKDIELNETFRRYEKCRSPTYKVAYRDDITSVVNYIAKDMLTSTTNHLVLNFYNRLKRYLKETNPTMTGASIYEVMKGIYDEKYKGSDKLVLHYRSRLGNKPPYAKFVKTNPSAIIAIYKEILDYNKTIGKRLFSLLPTKSGFQMSYITIDNSVLRDMIIDDNLFYIPKGERTEFKRDIEAHYKTYWNRLFNIGDYETCNREFAHMFKTDGKTVSIVLEIPFRAKKEVKVKGKKKAKSDKPNPYEGINISDYDIVVGIDPGLRYTFVSANNRDELDRCSGKEYYHDIGINRKNFQQNMCYARNQAFMDYKSNMPSSKTNDLASLCSYITYALKGLDNAFQVHFVNPFRKWKFTTYIKQQAKFRSLCKTITKKKNKFDDSTKTIVGFGDWSNPNDSIIRGHRRGPVLKLKEELKRWCKVVEVKEFRTSKLCCCCHHETTKVAMDDSDFKYTDRRVNEDDYRRSKLNSVLRCSNNECGITIDRDINGAKNIKMVFTRTLLGERLPEEFYR